MLFPVYSAPTISTVSSAPPSTSQPVSPKAKLVHEAEVRYILILLMSVFIDICIQQCDVCFFVFVSGVS